MIDVRLSIVSDCHSIAPRMREADCIEVQAQGYTPFQALFDSYIYSTEKYTCLVNNIPEVMFGCSQLKDTPNVAGIWLLGTDAITEHGVRFLRESNKYLKLISKPYDMTFNYVHVDNKVHIRWLQWMKFTFLREVKGHGVNGENFYEFARIT